MAKRQKAQTFALVLYLQEIIPISQLRINGKTGNIDIRGLVKDVNTGVSIKRDRVGKYSEEYEVCKTPCSGLSHLLTSRWF